MFLDTLNSVCSLRKSIQRFPIAAVYSVKNLATWLSGTRGRAFLGENVADRSITRAGAKMARLRASSDALGGSHFGRHR